MKRFEPEIPGEMIEEFTARAAVLSDMFRELSVPETATRVISGLIQRDPKIHGDFLDRLEPDRWPFGRLDLCLRIPDYISREITAPPRDVEVLVIRSPLTQEEEWRLLLILWRCQRQGHPADTRQAAVFKAKNGLLPMGVRTIVEPGVCQDRLKAAGLLEDAFERVRDSFEVIWPTGGFIDLCLPG